MSFGGPILIISAAAAYCLSNVGLKYVNEQDHVPFATMLMCRGGLTILSNAVFVTTRDGPSATIDMFKGRGYVKSRGRRDFYREMGRVYGRGMVGILATSLLIFVFTSMMRFSDAFSIFLGFSTFISMIVSATVLAEPVKAPSVVGGLLSVVGITLVSRPKVIFGSDEDDDDERTITSLGVVLLGISGFAQAMFFAMSRTFAKSHSPETLLHGFSTSIVTFFTTRINTHHTRTTSTSQ